MQKRFGLSFRLLLALFLLNGLLAHAQFKNEDELKAQADKYFQAGDYTNGYKLYSQIVSTYPKDAEYNYRLGVCMLFTDPDKKKCYPYLEYANKNIKDCEKEVKFYLGKAYHLNFRFDDAIKFYNDYKNIGSSAMVKKLQVDHEIQTCKNGKRLLGNLSELVVLEKKRLPDADYFRSYDLKDIGGKLLVRPSMFTTATDKKKDNKSIIYLPKGNDKLYYASYGDNDNNGKDIYIVRKLPNGDWSKPQALGAPINTPYDEDYPFLHPNGKVLYFASKGHNSMGGYDLFKSEYDEATQKWKDPVNLDFPINSPDDDILFVTDSLEKTAYFSSGRYSPSGYTDVLKINTERRPMDFAFIKGTVLKATPSQSVRSKIKVKNIETGEDIGTYAAKENGEYSMQLPNGGKFIFTVETPGFATQSEGINIPPAYSLSPYKQLVSYENEKLVIKNMFDENKDPENNYMQFIDLIEEKSKLEVNADDFVNVPAKNNTANTNTTSNNSTSDPGKDSVNKNPANTNPKNLKNEDIIKIAYDDAKELKEEAVKLKSDANDAFTFANNKDIEADQKTKEATIAQEKANKETDPSKKDALTSEAKRLKEEADLLNSQVNTANNIAKQLETDASNKQQEAELQEKYAKQLEEVNKTKNNKDAIAKLEQIQKELDAISDNKNNTGDLAKSIKAEADRKEQELKKAEATLPGLRKEADEMKNDLASLEKEIAVTKDPGLKENFKGQQEELKNDLAEKNKEIEANESKVELLRKESEALKSQADFANTMLTTVKSSDPVVASTNTNTTATNNATTNPDNNTASNNNSPNTSPTNTANNNSTATNPANNTASNTNSVNNNTTNPANNNTTTSQNTTANNNTASNANSANNNTASNNNTATNATNPANNSGSNTTANNNTATNTNPANNTTSNGNTAANNNTAPNTNPANNTTTNPENNTANTNAANNNGSVKNGSSELQDQLNNLVAKNQAVNNGQENALFNGVTYTDPKSIALKKQASDKLDASKAMNDELLKKIAELESGLKNGGGVTEQSIQEQNKEADRLTDEAAALRKNLASLSGTEKQQAQDKITELDKKAGEIRLQAVNDQSALHQSQFANNSVNLAELAKLSEKKSNEDTEQANLLVDEAKNYMKEAKRIREEANAETNIAARLGSLSNADEKERIALYKQEQALTIFKQYNPNYAMKQPAENTIAANSANNAKLKEVKDQVAAEAKSRNDALKLLADANKAEYNTQLLALNNLEKKPSDNPEIKVLKGKGQQNMLDGNSLLIKGNNARDEAEKNKFYIEANQKFEEAIRNIAQAIQLHNGVENIASNNTANNTTANNTTTNNSTTTNNTANTTTANNNTASNNTANNNTNTTTANNNTENNNTTNNTAAVNNTGLSDEQVKEVKATPEYQNFVTLKNEVDKLNDVANKEAAKSAAFYEQEAQHRKEADEIRKKAEAEPDGAKKLALQKQADDLYKITALSKASGDSVTELASNTKALAVSKQQEADLFVQSLDQKTYEEIVAVKENRPVANNNTATTNTANNTTTNNTASNPELSTSNAAGNNPDVKFAAYSPAFRADAKDFENQLKPFEKKEGTVENLNAHNAVLNNYVKSIYAEIAVLKKKLNTASGDNRTTINKQIKDLEDLLDQQQNAINTNAFKIKAIEQSSQPVTNNNAGNNNNAANNTTANTNNNTNNTASTTTTNNTAAANNTTNNSPNTNTANTNTSASAATYLSGKGFEVKSVDAYTVARPIPVDEKLPEGLLFRVQIGAFRNVIPQNLFKGLTPLSGETTQQGLIRYLAGLFNEFEKANAVKNDLKKLGYSDAFVVAYLNGKRISLNEAFGQLKSAGKNVSIDPNASAGITINSNVPDNTAVNNTINNTANNNAGTASNTTGATTAAAANGSDLGTTSGMLFTVQIGVYSNRVTGTQLLNLKPIYREKLPNGYFRYTAGIYNNLDRVKADKARVNALGITDAFVSVYYNGQRIKVNDALTKLGAGEQIKFPSENPIVFDGSAPAPETNPVNNPPANNTGVTPFSNGVTQGPAPTAENGVKTGDEGITFKVQIGAFRNQVPQSVADNFLKIKTWPIKYITINDLFVYTVGSFVNAKSAKVLQQEAVNSGITDAFIIVLKDGKKLTGEEARSYFNQ